MKEFLSVEEILDFAIREEEQAAEFYTNLASRIEKPGMREVFEEFAQEELGHKAKLLGIKKGKLLAPATQRVMDLKIVLMTVWAVLFAKGAY